jgi:hypothetical protein
VSTREIDRGESDRLGVMNIN